MTQAHFPIYFLKPAEASTELLNGARPSVSNLLANTEALLQNIEATKSSIKAQLSITNFPANTETMSNTQHTNSLSVTNKENISNKSEHSTTLRKYLNTYNHKTKSSTHAIDDYS